MVILKEAKCTVGEFKEALVWSGLAAYTSANYYTDLSDASPMSAMTPLQSTTIASHIGQSWYKVACYLNIEPDTIRASLPPGHTIVAESEALMNYIRGK